MDILLQERPLKTLKIPLGFSYLTLYDYMTPPRGLLGSWRGGRRPPQLGPYESGDLKGPPALRRSEKEGGRRPPEPSRFFNSRWLFI